jgi:hypothetical protein
VVDFLESLIVIVLTTRYVSLFFTHVGSLAGTLRFHGAHCHGVLLRGEVGAMPIIQRVRREGMRMSRTKGVGDKCMCRVTSTLAGSCTPGKTATLTFIGWG